MTKIIIAPIFILATPILVCAVLAECLLFEVPKALIEFYKIWRVT